MIGSSTSKARGHRRGRNESRQAAPAGSPFRHVSRCGHTPPWPASACEERGGTNRIQRATGPAEAQPGQGFSSPSCRDSCVARGYRSEKGKDKRRGTLLRGRVRSHPQTRRISLLSCGGDRRGVKTICEMTPNFPRRPSRPGRASDTGYHTGTRHVPSSPSLPLEGGCRRTFPLDKDSEEQVLGVGRVMGLVRDALSIFVLVKLDFIIICICVRQRVAASQVWRSSGFASQWTPPRPCPSSEMGAGTAQT